MKRKILIVNLITFLRIMGIIIIPILLMNYSAVATLIVTGTIFVTDFLDGFLARKWSVSTFFGATLDVISDKLLIYVILFHLCFKYPIYFIPIIFLELLIVVVNVYKTSNGYNIKANYFGKTKTALVFVGIIISYMVIESGSLYTATSLSIFFTLIENKDIILQVTAFTMILAECIVAISYILNSKSEKYFSKEKLHIIKNIKKIFTYAIDPGFYEEHKNDSQAMLVKNIIKKVS